ncbi:inorganic phosphate transporter [Coxiella-like endosymbiont]|uniref:inorganic phosphate transporter n=1 Tax=Coxiella-like endosymbiont TaxID=1592897 RepID=UPI00272A4BFC|nr:inorganic phosphate transporter [Coxiella-like endosymbiont]
MYMGYRVIATIGTDITQLTPSCGFAAQLSAAATVVVTSASGEVAYFDHPNFSGCAVLVVGFA